jgi:hypothetical protein
VARIGLGDVHAGADSDLGGTTGRLETQGGDAWQTGGKERAIGRLGLCHQSKPVPRSTPVGAAAGAPSEVVALVSSRSRLPPSTFATSLSPPAHHEAPAASPGPASGQNRCTARERFPRRAPEALPAIDGCLAFRVSLRPTPSARSARTPCTIVAPAVRTVPSALRLSSAKGVSQPLAESQPDGRFLPDSWSPVPSPCVRLSHDNASTKADISTWLEPDISMCLLHQGVRQSLTMSTCPLYPAPKEDWHPTPRFRRWRARS